MQGDYQNRRGFTLIELSVIIVLLALFAAIVAPNMLAIKRSRAQLDREAAILRLPQEARNEAQERRTPIALRLEEDALVMETEPAEGEDAQTIKQVSFTGMAVETTQLNGESTDTSSWRWVAYPDGSADTGGVEFSLNGSQKSLELPRFGDAKWLRGALPDVQQERWQAGELEQRVTQ